MLQMTLFFRILLQPIKMMSLHHISRPKLIYFSNLPTILKPSLVPRVPRYHAFYDPEIRFRLNQEAI